MQSRSGGVFGWWVLWSVGDLDRPVVESFADGVFVGFDWPGGWRSGRFDGSGGGVDHPAVGVGEGEPVGVVGVAGDAEQTSVMQPVTGGTDAGQVPGVGRTVVL